MAKEINIQMAEAKETEKEIIDTRESYRRFAYRGSILYFCISNLSQVCPWCGWV